MKPDDIYVLSLAAQAQSLDRRQRVYLRSPPSYKPSQCTPLFLAAFTKRRAGCCIHTHSHWAVLVTLLLEAQGPGNDREFRINNIEQIKGFGRGFEKSGNLGYHDTLVIPVIENTAHEEDLTEFLEEAMDKYPDTYAVLVRRHGVYVWGENVHKAKTQCERCALLFSSPPAPSQDLADVSQPRLPLPARRRDEAAQPPVDNQHRARGAAEVIAKPKNQNQKSPPPLTSTQPQVTTPPISNNRVFFLSCSA
jgi:ribulose-5-phosphate 4-epimerase/fuculose-1-phosphate aldolase